MNYTNLLDLRNLIEDAKKIILLLVFALVAYSAYRLNAGYLVYAVGVFSLHYLLDIVDDYLCNKFKASQEALETKRIGLEFVENLKRKQKALALAV